MKKKKAKKLAIKKWKAIVKNKGKELSFKQIQKFITYDMSITNDDCSYCYKYVTKKGSCKECPLKIKGLHPKDSQFACLDTGHPFNTWHNEKTVENAKAVLKLIKET